MHFFTRLPPAVLLRLRRDPSTNLKPPAALLVLALVCAIAAVSSDAHLAWALVSAAAAGGALTAHRRGARWPWEVHLLLARVRLAAAGPAPERSGPPSTVGSQVHAPPGQCTPVIAFRRLSIVELFTAAGRVLTRYWPALVGIPVAILATFVLVFVPILSAVMGALFSASTDTSGGVVTSTVTDPAPTLNTLLVAYAVMLLVCILVAFPADALLLGASVIATQHAVRGASITLSGLWSATRRRLPAICRMTAVFYALALSPELILLSLLVFTGGIISPETVAVVNVIAVFVALATFVFGIFLSLAPIILLAEQRSVIDALRRSMTLARAGFTRLLGLHLMWVAIVVPLMLFSYAIGFSIVLYAALIGVLIAVFRVFQVLIYTDLRLRYEDFGAELEREVNERASHLNPPRESRRTPEAGSAPRGEDVAAPEETVNADVPRTTSIRETARRSFAGFRDRATSRNEISAVDDVPPDIELSHRQRLVVALSVIGGVLLVTFAGTVTSLIQRGPAVTEVDPAQYYAQSEGRWGYFFTSADLRWRCAILPTRERGAVGCQPADPTIPGLPVAGTPEMVVDPLFGTEVHPNTFILERGARSEITWLGQAEFYRFPTEETPILPLSSEISGDGFTCRVGATAAVSCRDDHTGRGFGFSPNDYALF